jgi:hypothetical protein
MEWNTNFITLFKYSMMKWNKITTLSFEKWMQWIEMNYNNFISILPLFKNINHY